MNLRVVLLAFFDALVGFIVTTVTSLLAVWSQGDISKFSDVNEVAYATVVLGGVVAALKVLQSHLLTPRMAMLDGMNEDLK